MSNVGNKGKFSDRLNRMKLIRYAKKLKLKVGESLSFQDSTEVKKKIIGGSSVVVFALGKGISQTAFPYDEQKGNSSLEKVGLNSHSDRANENLKGREEVVVTKETSISVDDRDVLPEKPAELLKRKAVETASVGAAVVGAIGVNLLGGTTARATSLQEEDLSDTSLREASVKEKSVVSSKQNQENALKINFGNSSRRSFPRVFHSGNDVIVIDKISDSDIIRGDQKTYLLSQIVKKIKREFERKLDEVEVLESELYLLNDKNENELDLERCREIKKEIEEAIAKINHLISQYNIYQHNHLLDDMLDIDDHTLVDDISDFKRLYEGAEIQRRLASDYELITKYQSLYQKLEAIKGNVDDLSSKNEDKLIIYDKRDKKYQKIESQIDHTLKFEKDCESYIQKQNQYIEDIQRKVGQIDVSQITNYKLKGFGDLVGSVFQYLSLRFRMPFSSTLSGIFFRSYMANRMLCNLRSALRLEKVTNTRYQVEDFQFELNEKIHTLDYNYENISKAIGNVKGLKEEFMEQYQYDLPGYNEILRKINEIESLVYQNKEKLDIIRDKLKKNKLINEKTLKRCRILEQESKPRVESL